MRSRGLWQWLAIAGHAFAIAGAAACEAIIGAEEHRLLVGDGGVDPDARVDGSSTATDAPSEASLLLSDAVEVIASGQASPRGIALDERSVYWANQSDGTIAAWEKAGGAARVFARGATLPRWVVLDPTQVFWNSDSQGDCVPGILKLPKNAVPDAGPVQVARCSDAMHRINGLGVDGTFVYWTSHPSGTTLYSVPKEGGQFGALAANLGGQPDALAVTADGIYWLNPPQGKVSRYDKAAQQVTTLVENLTGLGAIGAEVGYVYYATTTNVSRIPTTASVDAGSASQPIATGQDGPTSLALFGEHVYWANAGSGLVVRAPKVGGAVEPIAKEQTGVRSVAVDATGVYFTRDTGEVARVRFR